MYNPYNSPINKSKPHLQLDSFTRDQSPNRLRNTLLPRQLSNLSQINRLRHSCSAGSIRFFDQYSTVNNPPQEQRRKTYENLKNTLKELEHRVWQVNSSLIGGNFTKKKTQQILPQQNEPNSDKNRQTISTETTDLCLRQQKKSQFITSQPKPVNYHPPLANPYDSKKYNLYYISEAVRAVNEKNSLAVEHITGSIKMIQSCLQYVNEGISPKSYVGFEMKRLPKDMNKKKVLVLDLDETLIHCYENWEVETDLRLSMKIEGQGVRVGVNIRPYAMTFLKKMAKQFEVVIFTASHQTYADAILDELDPDKQIFSHRFYRQHCLVLPNQLHVKDLRYLKRDLKDVVLVDNAAYSYAFQLENGVPILPFYEGKDFELAVLEKYLERLLEVEDVRVVNRGYFRLAEYTKFETAQELIKKLYVEHFR